jgi:TetR/AcrR family transcriptional regulator, cholesterol catabolism regulator
LPVKSGPTARAEDRRAQIVAKAADLFDEKGYHGATMEDIGDAIGLAKPTLYHYFPSKDHILYAIHDDFIDLLISRQERRMAVDMPADQMLRELMGDILELMETHRGHVRVFFEHHRELTGEPRERIAEKRNRYEQMIRDIFVQGAENGSLRDVDPELATLALAGMCNWTYQWYQPQGRLASRDIAYVFWDYLVNGLATKGNGSGTGS